MATALCLACIAGTATAVGLFSGVVATLLSAAGLLLAAFFAAIAIGSKITIRRQWRIEDGRPDMFLELNESRSERSLGRSNISWSRLRRALSRGVCGHPFMVGDSVRIKTLDQIRATLDASGNLDKLPFLEEMSPFCGQEARVFRVVDKIYDYGRSRLMRNLEQSVLLTGLRCDGSAHGGCQAACYLIWKADWLEPLPESSPVESTRSSTEYRSVARPTERVADPPTTEPIYSCQYTSLAAASTPLKRIPVRNLIIPVACGNVTMAAYLLVLMTRLVNVIQGLRGGAGFPSMPSPTAEATKPANLGLATGQTVRVKKPEEIARTLDANSKNRGLWFDRDMLKHCGQTYRVRGRVEKIIDVNSGKVIPMKTACITLEDVHYSGEFQLFGEQHDYLYWREAWLTPVE